MTPHEIERFWAMVDKSEGVDSCWIWFGAKSSKGYGTFRISRKSFYAHRISYELVNGTLGSLHALHRCDTPACVNPKHLFAGTHRDNMLDRDMKGRVRRGEEGGGAKLSSASMLEIKARYAAGGVRQKDLAQQYGITQSAVSLIVSGKRWKHDVRV